TIVREIYDTLNPDQRLLNAELQPFWTPLTLIELCAQVRWLWVRAHAELMPLMSGLTTYRLTPGGDWQKGTLVATSQLTFHRDSDKTEYLEVSSGQWHFGDSCYSETNILRLQTATPLTQSIWQMGDLKSHLSRHLCQRSPVLAHLMTGTMVELTLPHETFPCATFKVSKHMQLQLTLKFYPLE
ncbi:MAG: hypothetical protein F6K42_32435, partial [Leptolyngbya sp. SIO1D8]|nr:hypothetical protein [Leptolyngbya sp. SIO1D8]